MWRRSAVVRLRHLAGVNARFVDPVDEAHRAYEAQHELGQQRKAQVHHHFAHEHPEDGINRFSGGTRLGGARVIVESTQAFYRPVEKDELPLHFVQRTPQSAGLTPLICRELRRLNIPTLTELQSALIPLMLRGRHVLAHAETGSGKSFGVTLAVCNRIARETVAGRLHTVIMVPTTELAQQYDRWFKHFAGSARHVIFALSEHVAIEDQLARLHNFQPHVLVGTPQSIGLVQHHAPHLFGTKLRRKVDTIVLDEADVVLQAPVELPRAHSSSSSTVTLSGADVIDRLYRNQPDELPAHMVAMSATIDGVTARMINSWMVNEDAIRLTTSIVEHNIPDSITFYTVPASRLAPPLKCLDLTLRLIRAQHRLDLSGAGGSSSPLEPKILILTDMNVSEVEAAIDGVNKHVAASLSATATTADREEATAAFRYGRLSAIDEPMDFAADDAQHHLAGTTSRTAVGGRGKSGARQQQEPVALSFEVGRSLRRGFRHIFAVNESAVSRLTRGLINVGIAGFTAARGLHIDGVTHVILLGAVPTPSEIVHCAGRTGRNGVLGEVVAIFDPKDARHIQQLYDVVGIPWRVNRPTDLEKLVEAEESSSEHAATAVGDRIRTAVAERLDADSTRNTLSKARLLELRSQAAHAAATSAASAGDDDPLVDHPDFDAAILDVSHFASSKPGRAAPPERMPVFRSDDAVVAPPLAAAVAADRPYQQDEGTQPQALLQPSADSLFDEL